jgi:hypothetical protein
MFASLRNLLSRSPRSLKPVVARRRQSSPLQIETLEDRMALSTLMTAASVASVASPTSGVTTYFTTLKDPGSFYNPFQVVGNTLNVYGSSSSDTFKFTAGTTSNTVTLNTTTININPSQIHNINFYGHGGTAVLTDQLNTATATSNPHAMTLTGSNYNVSTSNVYQNEFFGRGGDFATFNDSPGNDTFYTVGGFASMHDSASTYTNSVTGVSYISASSTHGGVDTAIFQGTTANDNFLAGAGWAQINRAGSEASTTGFADNYAYASPYGGHVYLYDTNINGNTAPGINGGSTPAILLVNNSSAQLDTAISSAYVSGFSTVTANSTSFNDQVDYSDYQLAYTLYLEGVNWSDPNN